MLVITAEVWPAGDPRVRHRIGTIVASNESDLAAVSRYSVHLSQNGAPAMGVEPLELAFEVAGHRRSDGPWALVHAILARALHGPTGGLDVGAKPPGPG
ncbi:hypothetical protein [uncultured Sphingomonas sp.]|uniref:hypothetical protein n=1 Tax=uncultured Sphingomonas sp. TaxID=158754 RepID=UPI00260B6169|nr:hypothetical protein [uncultured Sphingomonas sp.]